MAKLNIKKIKFYKTLEPVFKLKQKYIIAKDYLNTKQLIVKQYSFINCNDDLEALVSSNNNLYELIPDDTPLRIYFNLEIEQEMTPEQEQERLNIFIKWIKVGICAVGSYC